MDDKLAVLKQVFETQMPFNKLLGLKVIELKDGFTKILIPFKEEFIGDFIQKRWHGGIQASIADSAGGIAALTSISSFEEKVNTIDMRIDYLHGSEPKDIYAEAEIIKDGKRIIKVDVKLYHEKTKIIALARCAFSVLRK
ncbi:MAG TPA: phenylacetic acid degradation protein [Flavobacteriaceae bacterium]|nr:phenylacetic acid degradation protein [Flavobacteriaceae bacterium]HBS10983.1 phenylacetic acid degradation protein [Flavobacteriaceae bacterium]